MRLWWLAIMAMLMAFGSATAAFLDAVKEAIAIVAADRRIERKLT